MRHLSARLVSGCAGGIARSCLGHGRGLRPRRAGACRRAASRPTAGARAGTAARSSRRHPARSSCSAAPRGARTSRRTRHGRYTAPGAGRRHRRPARRRKKCSGRRDPSATRRTARRRAAGAAGRGVDDVAPQSGTVSSRTAPRPRRGRPSGRCAVYGSVLVCRHNPRREWTAGSSRRPGRPRSASGLGASWSIRARKRAGP